MGFNGGGEWRRLPGCRFESAELIASLIALAGCSPRLMDAALTPSAKSLREVYDAAPRVAARVGGTANWTVTSFPQLG